MAQKLRKLQVSKPSKLKVKKSSSRTNGRAPIAAGGASKANFPWTKLPLEIRQKILLEALASISYRKNRVGQAQSITVAGALIQPRGLVSEATQLSQNIRSMGCTFPASELLQPMQVYYKAISAAMNTLKAKIQQLQAKMHYVLVDYYHRYCPIREDKLSDLDKAIRHKNDKLFLLNLVYGEIEDYLEVC